MIRVEPGGIDSAAAWLFLKGRGPRYATLSPQIHLHLLAGGSKESTHSRARPRRRAAAPAIRRPAVIKTIFVSKDSEVHPLAMTWSTFILSTSNDHRGVPTFNSLASDESTVTSNFPGIQPEAQAHHATVRVSNDRPDLTAYLQLERNRSA